MTRKDKVFVFLLLLSLVIVFFDLFSLQKAFLGGDHREQQYPWAKFYQSQIRQFRLPWWTTLNQCGFPLLAEGQIGAFYPLNALFLFLLPIKFAYNYEILFQYLLGALLFYFYLRGRRVSEWGGFFASLVYLYGSSQGGYFYYNLISQKVVIWLPLTLILIDRLTEKRSWRPAFLLSMVFAVQIFGGYLQVAIYSILYSCIYFLYSWWKKRSASSFVLFAAAGIGGLFFSLAQLLPTFELSLLSSRANAAAGLAYVGSMLPLGFATLFYPSWDGFLGSEFYIGIAGLLFLLFAAFTRKSADEKFFLFAAVFFLLLALGKFSPLYRGIVELTHFNGFRTPIKFLFFVTFSCAVLAGFGFDKMFVEPLGEARHTMALRRISFFYLLMAAGAIWAPVALEPALLRWKPELLSVLQRYVEANIFGKAGHPYSLEYYMNKAQLFYDQVCGMISLNNSDTRLEWCLIVASFVLVLLLRRRTASAAPLKGLCCAFLFMDLFFYGFTSVKGNYEPYDSIDAPVNRSAIVDLLRADRSRFRVMEVYQEPSENRKFPVFPNFNMLNGIEDIGIYSPLAMRAYRDFLEGWGYVNDSLSINWVDPARLLERLRQVSFLNVKYILSTKNLSHPDLRFLMKEGEVLLYRNENVLPRAFFLPGLPSEEMFENVEGLKPAAIRRYGQTRIEIDCDAAEDGVLVLTDIAYPGWRVMVRGREEVFLPGFRYFRAVALKKGNNAVVFEYRPVLYQSLAAMALITAFTGLAALAVEKRFKFGKRPSGVIRV